MSDALTVSPSDGGPVVLTFRGALDETTASAIWGETLDAVRAPKADVVFDVTDVTTCDGSGLALLSDASQQARASGASMSFRGASGGLAELLRMADHDTDDKPAARPRIGAIEEVGNQSAALGATLGALVAFVGDLSVALIVGTVQLKPSRIKEILISCTRVGADAVPVVSLLGGLIGFILAVQCVNALESIGGTSLVPMVVGFATFREFGPLIAGIILAGRSGSAFAAEIGTMKVTEELDAYTTFGLDPMVVLVFPRIVAGTLVMPLLTLYSILLAIVGGFIPMAGVGYGFNTYVTGVIDSVAVGDLVQAIVKGVVFGFIFSALGCFHGLRTGSGADAVGSSTTRAVVSGIVAILIADSIISSIFYTLGI